MAQHSELESSGVPRTKITRGNFDASFPLASWPPTEREEGRNRSFLPRKAPPKGLCFFLPLGWWQRGRDWDRRAGEGGASASDSGAGSSDSDADAKANDRDRDIQKPPLHALGCRVSAVDAPRGGFMRPDTGDANDAPASAGAAAAQGHPKRRRVQKAVTHHQAIPGHHHHGLAPGPRRHTTPESTTRRTRSSPCT